MKKFGIDDKLVNAGQKIKTDYKIDDSIFLLERMNYLRHTSKKIVDKKHLYEETIANFNFKDRYKELSLKKKEISKRLIKLNKSESVFKFHDRWQQKNSNMPIFDLGNYEYGTVEISEVDHYLENMSQIVSPSDVEFQEMINNHWCRIKSGYYDLCWLKPYVELDRSINHDSYFSPGYEWNHQYGGLLFRFGLYDDAAWYRNDNPDRIFFLQEFGFDLGTTPCDAKITVQIRFKYAFVFTDNADDYSRYSFGILPIFSNSNGEFDVVTIDSSTGYSLHHGQSTASHEDELYITKSIERKRGEKLKLAIGVIQFLSAQDGYVELFGDYSLKHHRQGFSIFANYKPLLS